MRGGQSIPVHGADGGLAFGPTPNPQARQTVFDATFYRPVNTSFTGIFPNMGHTYLCRILSNGYLANLGPPKRHCTAEKQPLSKVVAQALHTWLKSKRSSSMVTAYGDPCTQSSSGMCESLVHWCRVPKCGIGQAVSQRLCASD